MATETALLLTGILTATGDKMLNEKLMITGLVTITLKDENGKIKERTVKNTVVTVGKNHVADQLSGQLEASMSHMAIGTGATPVALTDTTLGAEIVPRKTFTSKEQGTGADANKVIFVCSWPSGEGDGAITEAGIFNASSSGSMLCRTTFPVKNKGAGDSLAITWTLTVN